MTTPTGIYALMVAWAKSHGTASVDEAVRKWKKEGKYAVGLEATKRVQMSTQKRRSLTRKLWIKQGGVCARMNHAVELRDATIDHFESLNRGGKEELSNYRMVCGPHNASKSDNDVMQESRKTGMTILEAIPK